MSNSAKSGATPVRDFDGPYKALLDAYPRDALELLCGVNLDGREVIVEAPTEQLRSRQADRVYLVPNENGKIDVYHVEIQLKRTRDFQGRMVSYWSTLNLKYPEPDHDIHQVALWPEGRGLPGRYHRNGLWLHYLAVNMRDDLDPETLLNSPLAAFALWTRNPPPDVVERVADHIAALDDIEEQKQQITLGMLVGGALAAQLIEVLERKGMTDILEDTDTGRKIARKNLEQGLEQGLERGLEQGLERGLEQGHVDSMRVLLRAKFGDIADLEALAERLTAQDHEGNITRIATGATLDDLRA